MSSRGGSSSGQGRVYRWRERFDENFRRHRPEGERLFWGRGRDSHPGSCSRRPSRRAGHVRNPHLWYLHRWDCCRTWTVVVTALHRIDQTSPCIRRGRCPSWLQGQTVPVAASWPWRTVLDSHAWWSWGLPWVCLSLDGRGSRTGRQTNRQSEIAPTRTRSSSPYSVQSLLSPHPWQSPSSPHLFYPCMWEAHHFPWCRLSPLPPSVQWQIPNGGHHSSSGCGRILGLGCGKRWSGVTSCTLNEPLLDIPQ